MQQPQVITYADIVEVRTVTGAATCNQLLAEGWVLLGVYPLTTLGEMAEGRSRGEEEQKQPQDTQRYVRRFVGMSWGRVEGRKSRQLLLCLPLLTTTMITGTTYGVKKYHFWGTSEGCAHSIVKAVGGLDHFYERPLSESQIVCESPYLGISLITYL
jgi:hypothetical protein